jgi:hypothetical protein
MSLSHIQIKEYLHALVHIIILLRIEINNFLLLEE